MKQQGFTLIELLVTITILGLMTSILVPAGFAVENYHRKKVTSEQFEQIRRAILGDGDREIGFVGMTGTLPKLYQMTWNGSAWVQVKTAGGEPVATDNYLLASKIRGDHFAQPLALWDKSIGQTVPGWNRAMLPEPVNNQPNDPATDLFLETPSSESEREENRLFALTATKGRLFDGWGTALIVYVDDANGNGIYDDTLNDSSPNNLVFVSAGPNKRFDFDEPNSDDIELKIRQEDWDRRKEQVASTRTKLQKIREAIVGKSINFNGTAVPTGFIADVGNPEPFTGSYYRINGTSHVFRAKSDYQSVTSEPAGSSWEELSGYAVSKFPVWESGVSSYRPSLDPLVVNSSIVWHQGLVYRCVNTHSSGSSFDSDKWQIDGEFTIRDTLRYQWKSNTLYRKEIVGNQQFDSRSELHIGWRSPYLKGETELPISDSWGREIEASLDKDRNIILKSSGFHPTDPADDIVLTIYRSEFEGTVSLNVQSSTDNTIDWVELKFPYNGNAHRRRIAYNGNPTLITYGTATFPPAKDEGTAETTLDLTKGFADISHGMRTIAIKRTNGTSDTIYEKAVSIYPEFSNPVTIQILSIGTTP